MPLDRARRAPGRLRRPPRHDAGFLELQAEIAAAGAIEIRGALDRWLYYPLPLWKSAPVLLPALVALAVWAARAMPVQLLIGLVSLHFAVFCVLSGSSGAAGGFRERFLFAFVIALAPLLGALPLLYDRLSSRRVRRIAVGLVAILAVGAAAHGLRHPPQEYTPAADLPQLAESLGATARARGRPLALVMGPGTERDAFYLQVPNGRRLSVVSAATRGMRDPVALPAWVDVWVERLPSRVAAIPLDAGRVIGRYHLYGISARVPEPEPTLAGWSRRDEAGVLRRSCRRALWRSSSPPTTPAELDGRRGAIVPGGPHPRWGSLHIRRMYGLGSMRAASSSRFTSTGGWPSGATSRVQAGRTPRRSSFQPGRGRRSSRWC